MAFAITSYRSHSLPAYEPVTQQFIQVVRMTVTRASVDAVLDIGNLAGTFWASALTGSPALAVTAAAHFKNLVSKAQDIVSFRIPEVQDIRTKIVTGSPATLQFKEVSTSLGALRVDLFATDVAPTTINLVLCVTLLPGELPVSGI